MPPKKQSHQVTMALPAGEAPVAELGKMLGMTGVNLVALKKEYDARTVAQRGEIVPAVITIFDDRSFTLKLKTPPTSFLIKQATNGSKTLSHDQLRAIAERKMPDLNTTDIDAAMRTVAGTARSMGVKVS
ncbi:50S ribosomal protein L11 [Kibdelosporangium philippinense]|uniref:Large ribosomal subunit protein uL11 n=1 Tax=Kibdelosporangium philippinense TaxID=211113 RepID=A0ABS8ZNB7_9PSEU|nr:50S ribosomal protein L11 [Kibdelosporangium philippinense]MCE7009256.1 50S ribosomal protein L11 [Kibdelosporangium philippinense]